MPNIGPGELFVILLIALLVFGPKKLPELGKSLGAGIREFRRGTQGLKEELEGSFREAPSQAAAPAQTITAQAVVPPATAQVVTPAPAVVEEKPHA
ncbi:twin-arginine translocase TatA/TatE family subunit [Deinococcus sp. YIM 77859]|uniref:Sec-independent protein translocase subunit TatA/TatB n=1 Tax=Deinococcus sp. YIM 77859 TaxID=1540221 RepID=UPI00055302CD|nr:twin-arginine translocase TatA/TatE family subunit [Deinococcus sp. YIM 77859]